VRDARGGAGQPSRLNAESTLRWRNIVITAYGPTLLVAVGQGAILPLVALSARALGASVATAAFVVALIGLGQLVGDLPAGALAAKIGEK
jgi:MFS family permease